MKLSIETATEVNCRNDNRLEMLILSVYFGCSKFILNLRATIIFQIGSSPSN